MAGLLYNVSKSRQGCDEAGGGESGMNGITEKLRKGLLMALCIVMLLPAQNAQAASARQKALNAYGKWLSSSKVYILPKGTSYKPYSYSGTDKYKGTSSSQVRFALACIDNDSIPELLVYDSERCFGMFTYKSGKVVRISCDGWWNVADKYYKKQNMFTTSRTSASGIKSVKHYCRASGRYLCRFATYRYKSGAKHYAEFSLSGIRKNLKEAVFNARLAALTKGSTATKISYYKNTKANRKKVLK